MKDADGPKDEPATDLPMAPSSRARTTDGRRGRGEGRSTHREPPRRGHARATTATDVQVEIPLTGAADLERRMAPASAGPDADTSPEGHQRPQVTDVGTRKGPARRRTVLALTNEIQLQELRYRELFEFAPDAYLVTTTAGVVLEANHAAYELLNLPRESLLGRLLGIYLVSRLERPVIAEEMAALLSRPGSRREWVGRLRRRSNGIIDVAVTVGGVRDPVTHRLVGARWMVRDITAWVAAETEAHRLTADLERRVTERTRELEARTRQLAERSLEAETANRAKAQFLAAMSHEIRTPLNAVAGYAELLEMGIHGSITDRQRDFIRRIRRANTHLLGILNDILNFAKLESARVRYAAVPVSLNDTIDVALQVIEPQASAKGIAVERSSADSEVVAQADPDKVLQIALNLLTNAVKFTSPGGKITINCVADGNAAWLDVTDTGRGIPSDQLETIFEPFVQVGRVSTDVHEGVGLGLAISRDLARGMDGDLTVQSTLGAGSSFRVTLRQAQSGQPSPKAHEE
jgi:PAS domain S-box-containing protein